MKRLKTDLPAVDPVPDHAWKVLTTSPCILTAQHSGKRAVCDVFAAHKCAQTPIMVSVSVRSGHVIDTIIRDSRHFAVCTISPSERVLLRRLRDGVQRGVDPFDGVVFKRLQSTSPAPVSSTLALDCEVVRHIDLESDHEMYIGRVLAWCLREPLAITG